MLPLNRHRVNFHTAGESKSSVLKPDQPANKTARTARQQYAPKLRHSSMKSKTRRLSDQPKRPVM